MKFNRLLSLAFLAFFFTTSSAFASIELLMVGAGGAGGGMGGGAGGEVIYEASHAVIVQSYSVQVGQGGAGGRYFGGGAPVAGTASTFDGLTATPGGYGGDVVNQQNTCTNGGGDGSSLGSGGCASSVGQGTGGNSPSGGQGGGGGGYSGNGQNGNSTIAGSGGTGYTSSISGSSIQYACGGGGGTYNTNTRGLAGCSTAGNGSGGTTAPTAGTDGTGSGGGGASGVTYQTAGAGGDGVVIIKYLTGTVTATGGTITYSGSYTIHTFTADGTFVVTAVAGGGNGGSTVSAEIVTPATLYSSQLIQSPVSTSTYTFTSTIASSTLKQAGVVFIVRATSSSPTITWGGTAMTYLLSTDSDLYNVTDLFIINNPTTTASIVVSGISASSTKYISQSVWSNANLHSVVDEYTVIPGVSKASVSLPSVTVPTTILSSMYTVTGLEAYTLLSSSVVIHSATSSTGSFSIQRSSCASFLDECSVGYTKNFTLFDSTNGYLVGVNLYSTSTVSASAEEIGNSIIGSLGNDVSFTQCVESGIISGFTCVLQNIPFWLLRLFVPTQQDIVDVKDYIYTTITASTSMTSSIFLIPLQLSLWTASSSVPTFDDLTLSLPRANGSNYTYELIPQNTTNAQKRIDASLYSIFIWILGVFTLFFISKQFIKLIH